MTFDNLGSLITLCVSVVVFVGTAFVYLRGSADKGTVEALERRVGALDGLVEDRDKQMAAMEASAERDRKDMRLQLQTRDETIEQQKQQIHGLGRQVSLLQDIVTHKAEIERLQETLDAHHNEAREHWEAIKEALNR